MAKNRSEDQEMRAGRLILLMWFTLGIGFLPFGIMLDEIIGAGDLFLVIMVLYVIFFPFGPPILISMIYGQRGMGFVEPTHDEESDVEEWWMPDEKWPKSKSVTSNVNKHGFRSDDFDDSEEGFIFLGCSLTEGYGLEEHETWPWIVGEYFGVKVWNLAQGGQGDDVCFINALKWIPKLNPKAVCMLIPPYGRFNYVDTDQKEHHYSYNLNNLRNPKFPWLFDDKNIYLSMLKK